MAKTDIYSPLPSITRDNFIQILNEINRHPDVIAAHREWENLDEEWKDLQKSGAGDAEVALAATKVRVSKETKDIIFDHVARLCEHMAYEVDVIEDYTKDTIGKCRAIDNVEELSVDWHNLRRRGLGGSSLSKLLGIHWKSRVGSMEYVDDDELDEAWIESAIEKSTEVHHAHIPDSGVLYRGHLVEPALIARYAISRNKRVAVSKATWLGEEDFQVINLDGIILDDNGEPEGILECKTSSRDWTWQWGVPIGYRVQVLWYLRTLGLDYADVAVRFDSGVFSIYRINADETLDTTAYTHPIEEYVPDIRKRWNQLVELKDNPRELWGVSDRLNDELDYIGDFSIGGKLNEKDLSFLLHSDLLHIQCDHPYERMDQSFTIPIYAHVRKNEVMTTYRSLRAQPVFYNNFDKGGYVDYSKKMDTLIPDSDTLLCLNTETTRFVEDSVGYDEGVINLSALRRAVDVEPGRSDFTSIDEFIEWVESKKENLS